MITVCVYCSTEHVLKSLGKAQRKSLETHNKNPQEHCLEYKGLIFMTISVEYKISTDRKSVV